MKEVYIIVSPKGGISYNMYSGKGTVYANKETAKKKLTDKNEWSKIKGYGTYELLTLEVEE